MQTQTIDQVKALYPDEWVLLGDPLLSGATVAGGIVIYHSKDKQQIAYSSPNWRDHFQTAMTIFTGEQPKNRKFWL